MAKNSDLPGGSRSNETAAEKKERIDNTAIKQAEELKKRQAKNKADAEKRDAASRSTITEACCSTCGNEFIIGSMSYCTLNPVWEKVGKPSAHFCRQYDPEGLG